jgi:hypothetical protein
MVNDARASVSARVSREPEGRWRVAFFGRAEE